MNQATKKIELINIISSCMNHWSYYIFFILLNIMIVNNSLGQNWVQTNKRTASTRGHQHQFGAASSIYGDYSIVGTLNGRAVYIQKKVNGIWKQVKKLEEPGLLQLDYYGASVSLNEEFAVIGCPGIKNNGLNNVGMVFIYSRNFGGVNNWGLIKSLEDPFPNIGDQFGKSVQLLNDTLYVGSYDSRDVNEENPLGSAGAVMIFSKNHGGNNNWGFIKKICAAVRNQNDFFGFPIQIYNGRLLIGSSGQDYDPIDQNFISNAGAAYLYSKDQGGNNNWGLVKKLCAFDRQSNDYFGTSVSIFESQIVIGAPSEDHNSTGGGFLQDAGSIYMFKKDQGGINNWGLFKKIHAPINRNGNDRFGQALFIHQEQLLVGSPLADINLGNEGSVYCFTENQGGIGNWGFVNRIFASDVLTETGESFGSSICIEEGYAIIGANGNKTDKYGNNPIVQSGAVFYFENCPSGIISSVEGEASQNQLNALNSYVGSDCNLICNIQGNGYNISGQVTAKVWVDSIQNQEYVKRHYEIFPTINPSTASAKVTLFFTFEEFEDFNEINDIKLPTWFGDDAGKANVIIEKRPGISSDETGLPYSYSGPSLNIFPAAEDIIWNAGLQRWEISFTVTGFSGFFLKTKVQPLPLSLLTFTGKNEINLNTLFWSSTSEINVSGFEIQRSADGLNFDPIGFVKANNISDKSNYLFSDEKPTIGSNYYRLNMIDLDGSSSYSKIIHLNSPSKMDIKIFPNPGNGMYEIETDLNLNNSAVFIYDINGRRIDAILKDGKIDILNYPAGLYFLKVLTQDNFNFQTSLIKY